MKNLKLLLGTAAAAAMSIPAQTAVAQTTDDTVETLNDNERVLGAITVKARKVEENIQEVPVAVTAFDVEDIFKQGIQNIEDLSRRTPGFVFDTPFGRQFDRPIIRGQANILGDSGVSVFIDGVNVTQSIRSLNFGDIDTIEIIKGPQSALFGRNTYSGAINITTRQPTNEFKTDISLEGGADGLFQFLGNVRGPIIEDKLFYSLAARYYTFDSEFDVDGNVNPSIGNEESFTIGGTLEARPTNNWTLKLRASYNEDDDGHFPIGLLGFEDLNVNVPGGIDLGGVQPFFQGVVPTSFPMPSGSDQLSDTLGEGGGIEREEFFIALNSDVEFAGGYNLFTTLGYTQEDFRDELDSDGQLSSFGTARIFGPFPAGPGAGVGLIPFDFTTTDDDELETFVAEARIDSPQDRAFRWRFGGYYFNTVDRDMDLLERFEDPQFEAAAQASFDQGLDDILAALQAGNPPFSPPFFIFSAVPFDFGPTDSETLRTENVSVFGSISYDLSDRVTVSAEARWAEESLNLRTFDPFTGEQLTLTDENGDIVPFDVSESFTAITPRFTVDWQVTDANLLYGSIANGTKPGGFNGAQGFEFGFGTFEEEENWQYEIGSKNFFFDDQLLLNGAFFFSTLSDYQLTENLAALGANTTTGSVTANVGDADIFGIELDGAFSPDALPGVTIGGTYAWTDTEFKEGTEATQGAVFGDSSIVGQEIPRQARHQASFFADYETDLTSNL
ncbi:MAG: TonB-dependent receptor, partial [Pseudomonadota bacterium]